jgi:cell division protein FtsQ
LLGLTPAPATEADPDAAAAESKAESKAESTTESAAAAPGPPADASADPSNDPAGARVTAPVEEVVTAAEAARSLEPATDEAEPAEPVPTAEPVHGAAPVRNTIRIGGDDDLPDAVYLEPSDDRRGGDRSDSGSTSRNTILIADDELEGAAGGIPVATGSSASMDPRLRARRIAVKRAVGRKRLKWIILVLSLVAILTTGLAILGSSMFAVQQDKLSISGPRRMSEATLDAAVQKIVDHPVLLIDTHSIEVALERDPWVEEARVRTKFPHSASIEIRERVPIATYQGTDGQFRIIDVNGMVVDVIPGQPIEFMLITGPPIDASPGASAGTNLRHAAEVVQALSPGVRSRTEAVTVDATGALGLTFHSGTKVAFGPATDLLDKLTTLEAFLKRPQGIECTTTIDVQTNEPACTGG